jgi:Short C-terminal domain
VTQSFHSDETEVSGFGSLPRPGRAFVFATGVDSFGEYPSASALRLRGVRVNAAHEPSGRYPDHDDGPGSLERELAEFVRGEQPPSAAGWRMDHGRWICVPHNRTFCKVCSAAAPSTSAAQRRSRATPGADGSRMSERLSDDLPGQIERLARMHEHGVLNDDEFAAAKQKLLDS